MENWENKHQPYSYIFAWNFILSPLLLSLCYSWKLLGYFSLELRNLTFICLGGQCFSLVMVMTNVRLLVQRMLFFFKHILLFLYHFSPGNFVGQQLNFLNCPVVFLNFFSFILSYLYFQKVSFFFLLINLFKTTPPCSLFTEAYLLENYMYTFWSCLPFPILYLLIFFVSLFFYLFFKFLTFVLKASSVK